MRRLKIILFKTLILVLLFSGCQSHEERITGRWKRTIAYGCDGNSNFDNFFLNSHIILNFKNNSKDERYYIEFRGENLYALNHTGDTISFGISGRKLMISLPPLAEITEMVGFSHSDKFDFCDSIRYIDKILYKGENTVSNKNFISFFKHKKIDVQGKITDFEIEFNKAKDYSVFYIDTLRSTIDLNGTPTGDEWEGVFDF